MEFKISTKPSYTLLTPIANDLDANLTAAISQKWNELRQSGSRNLILDLRNCINANETAAGHLTAFHEECYNNNESLVFTALQDSTLKVFKQQELDSVLNIAPTMAEAIDIVNMEILERDLFNEE